MPPIKENDIEEMAIEELMALGYSHVFGDDLSPDKAPEERPQFSDVVLRKEFFSSLKRINQGLPEAALETAFKKVLAIASSRDVSQNELFHRFLLEGVPVEYRKNDEIIGGRVNLMSRDDLSLNRFIVCNQLTIVEQGINKRPDIILFCNGLPIVLFELKNPADEQATIEKAFSQIQTYKATIPQLFCFNEICIISDGLSTKVGSYTAPFSRFSTWKKEEPIAISEDELSIVISSLLNSSTLIDYLTYFVTYEKTKVENPKTHKLIRIETVKKIAAYHQYYAVNKAIDRTIKASSAGGNKKAGVIWHTQGSGKSLTMVFFVAKLSRMPQMSNPTFVVINDRDDLDDQLFDTFAGNARILGQTPVEVETSKQLRGLLNVSSGGIVFSTIQKFFPEAGEEKIAAFSNRSNIIVIADEAHRTEYGFDAKVVDIVSNGQVLGSKISYGFAKYLRDALPEATYLGFTGTPIEDKGKSTPAVFGDYIDIYDISRAVDDHVTVKIYYESRLAKISLSEDGKKLIEQFDTTIDAPSESDEETSDYSDEAKRKWATLEGIIGNPNTIADIARDIVGHFEERQKNFSGKAMIVAMSRKMAVSLFNAIIKIRPNWYSKDLSQGAIKVVMTSVSSDGPEMQKHKTTKAERKALSLRMKDPDDPLKIVIVRDMWLTGFDDPCLNTMYVIKPMKGHTLMQAIARVNRVFLDKPGGLIVDYVGIGTSLRDALNFYAKSGGKGELIIPHEKAIEIMSEKLEVVRQLLRGFDYSSFFTETTKNKLSMILKAEDYVLSLEDGKSRFSNEVSLLSQAYALAKPDPKTFECSEEVAFFQAVKARINKVAGGFDGSDSHDMDSVVKDIVSSSIQSDGVVDLFDAVGLKKPEVSILSDDFLSEVKSMDNQHLAAELLEKLIGQEARKRNKENLTLGKTLLDLVSGAINKYRNNLLTTAQVIDELIQIAKEIKASDKRQEDMHMTSDELAFYDALNLNDSAVKVMGDEKLKMIAREVAEKVRKNATIDWTLKESSRAKLFAIVHRTLNKYGYPPDKQKQATQIVINQAKSLADKWSDNL
jgi:type I restriction enzyme, R subunit